MKNYKKIKSISPIYPEMMSEKANLLVAKEFYEIQKELDDLNERRMQILKDERLLEQREAKFRELSKFFNIEYEDVEINPIREKVNMQIINPSDYRNK